MATTIHQSVTKHSSSDFGRDQIFPTDTASKQSRSSHHQLDYSGETQHKNANCCAEKSDYNSGESHKYKTSEKAFLFHGFGIPYSVLVFTSIYVEKCHLVSSYDLRIHTSRWFCQHVFIIYVFINMFLKLTNNCEVVDAFFLFYVLW